MTETTEEKDSIDEAIAHLAGLNEFLEFRDYLNSRQGHTAPAGDFLCAISKFVTSLTKERDELKKFIKFSEKKSIKARYFYTSPSVDGEYAHLSELLENCENSDIIQVFPAMTTGYSPRWYVYDDEYYTPYYTEVEAKNAVASLQSKEVE